MKTKENGSRDGDLVNRQEAIDALENEVRLIDGYYTMDDEVIDKDDAIEAIRLLPSAQPEIIHCRDCIQSLFSGLGCDRVYCMKHSHYMYEDDFCSYAVRESNGTS